MVILLFLVCTLHTYLIVTEHNQRNLQTGQRRNRHPHIAHSTHRNRAEIYNVHSNAIAMYAMQVGYHKPRNFTVTLPFPQVFLPTINNPIQAIPLACSLHAPCKDQFIANSFTSNINVEFGGISPCAFLPYPRCAGIVIRRSPPTCMPAKPISMPLITSLLPILKVKGAPFLFATWQC